MLIKRSFNSDGQVLIIIIKTGKCVPELRGPALVWLKALDEKLA